MSVYTAYEDRNELQEPLTDSGESGLGASRMPIRRTCNDVFFAVVFAAAMIAMIVFSAIGFARGDPSRLVPISSLSPDLIAAAKASANNNVRWWITDSVAELKDQVGVVCGAVALALALGFVWVQFMKWFTKPFIYIVLVGSVAAIGGLGAFLIVEAVQGHSGSLFSTQSSTWEGVLGGFFVAVALVLLVAFLALRSKLSLTCAVIKEACSGINATPSLLAASLLVLACYVAFAVWWAVSVLYIFSIPSDVIPLAVAGEASAEFVVFEASLTNCVFYMVFCFFWASEFASGVLQMTVAGGVAHWYFGRKSSLRTAGASSGTFATLMRALTLSLGSVALGSLIIAVVDFVNWLVQRARSANPHNKLLRCLLWGVQCVLGCIRGLLRAVTRYTYIYIAIHGDPFCRASRECFALVSRSAVHAVLLDTVTGYVVLVAKVLAAAICALLAALVTHAAYGSVSFAATTAVAVAAYFVLSLYGVLIRTAADTVLVCYFEDLEGNETDTNLSVALHEMLQSHASECVAKSDAVFENVPRN